MRYIRKGFCNKCGRCCKMDTLAPCVLKKLNETFGYGPRACPHLEDLGDGTTTCLNYENRPPFCIDFPGEPGDISEIPQCTYYFEVA